MTARGVIDIEKDLLELEGNLFPANVLNVILGSVPLIGTLVGDGLIGFSYGARGALSDPSVTVNPLSALTPGILRNLFSGDPER